MASEGKTQMRFDLRCGRCRYAMPEDWPRGRSVLRCGYEGNGQRRGRVTEVYPTSCAPSAVWPAPAWCVLAGSSVPPEERKTATP